MSLSCQRGLFEIPDEVDYLNCAYMSPLPRVVRTAGEAGVARKAQPYPRARRWQSGYVLAR
jgi:hypothetical protein